MTRRVRTSTRRRRRPRAPEPAALLLALKLLLAPGLVVGASLAGRRWGPFVAGTIGGLPVVAGPILLVVTIEHGVHFGARAGVGVLLGLVGLACFAIVYGLVSRAAGWVASLLAGWAAYLAVAAALRPVHPPVLVATVVAVLAIVAAARLIPPARPATVAARGGSVALPGWDLPLRALATAAMVLALTGVAGLVGPAWSGLLTPFPVIGSILPAFAHAQAGGDEARTTMRGIQMGLGGFVVFALVVALTVRQWGTAASFAAASAAALAATGLRAVLSPPRRPT